VLAGLDLAGVVFCGGEEKLGPGPLEEHYGMPVETDVEEGCAGWRRARTRSSTSPTSRRAGRRASCGWRRSRSAWGSPTRRRGAARAAALRAARFDGPKLAVIATGKRTGKTAVAGHWAACCATPAWTR
jgi:hypothetical protein